MKKFSMLLLCAAFFTTNPTFAMEDSAMEDFELEILGPIKKKQLEEIKARSDLKSLELANTELCDEDLSFLSGLTQLKTLSLCWNPRLTNACVPHLLPLTNLERLYIGSPIYCHLAPKITVEGYKKLLSSLPKLTFLSAQ